jgi:ribosomal protein L37AE/L43A
MGTMTAMSTVPPPDSPAQFRAKVRCSACDRQSNHRFRRGSHWTCPHCGRVNDGPARVAALEELNQARLNDLAKRRGKQATARQRQGAPLTADPASEPIQEAALEVVGKPSPRKRRPSAAPKAAPTPPVTAAPPPTPEPPKRRRWSVKSVLSGEWAEQEQAS